MEISLSISVLGGVEVAGRPLNARLERRLLAVLTVRRNQTITSDALADAVWEGKPPRAVESSLQSKVSRPRALLRGTGLSITNGGYGYLFAVPSDRCDADQFDKRCTAFLQAGVGASLDLAESALKLWRGAPFGEFATDEFAIAEATRLESQREAVEIRRIEILLELRRYAEVMIHAEPLQARFPHNDHICAIRLTALAGLGQLAEALRIGEAFRRHLADETGLNPSPELVAAERRILMAAEVEQVTELDTTRHRQAVAPMFGRQAELAEALDGMGNSRLLTLVGEGGIGKTRLATELARHVEVTAWCDIAVIQSENDLLRSIATAIGFSRSEHVPFDNLAERLSDSVLLVVDGCEHDWGVVSSGLARLLSTTSVRVLATSRVPLGIQGERVLRVAPLSTTTEVSPAVDMLIDRATAAGVHAMPSSEDLRVLATRLDGHPLAIELIAPRLSFLPVAEVLAALDRDSGWLQGDRSGTHQRSLLDVVGFSYASLSPASQRLFRALSVFRSPTGIDVISRLASRLQLNIDPTTALVELAEQSLVRVGEGRDGGMRYRVLAPLADVGRHLAVHADESAMLGYSHAIVMAEFVEGIAQQGFGPDEGRRADMIAEEFDNLRVAFAACQQHGWLDVSARLVGGLLNESMLRENVEVADWALELVDHPDLRLSDRSAQVLAVAAQAYLLRGDYIAAITTANLARRAMVDGALPAWPANSFLHLTAMMERLGAVDERAQRHRRALDDYTAQTGDPMGTAIGAFNHAYVTSSVGHPLDGLGSSLLGLRLGRRLNSPTLISMGLYGLARARASLNPAKALEHLTLAQTMAVRGRCGVMERHIVRELIAVGEGVDLAPGLARLTKECDRARIEHQLQEVVGLLIPMIRAGHHELVARVCGGLTRSIWRATADVRFANDYVRDQLGYERHKAFYSEGRRWAPDETVAAVLTLVAGLAIDVSEIANESGESS